MKKAVLVINYHQVVPEKSTGPGIDHVFSIARRDFEAQVSCLHKNQVPVVSLHDIITNTVPHDFSVAITADDGHASDSEIIYPLLKAKGMSAAFFWLSNSIHPANQAAAAAMLADGFTIGSHGISHADLTRSAQSEQRHELEFSKKIISEQTGHSVDHFAFPYGLYSAELLALARQAGYTAACSTDVKLNYPEDKPFLIHRWSVKHNTSLHEFEGLLTSQAARQRKQALSTVKKATKRLMGRSFADRINLLFNSRT